MFKTERMTVADWASCSDTDLAAVFDPEVVHALPPDFSRHTTRLEQRQFLSHLTSDEATQVQGIWVGDHLAGVLILFVDGATAHLGYVLSKPYWGQGLGQEVVSGLIAWAQATCHLNDIYGGVAVSNIASQKILQRAGFTSVAHPASDTIMYKWTRHAPY